MFHDALLGRGFSLEVDGAVKSEISCGGDETGNWQGVEERTGFDGREQSDNLFPGG